MDTTFCQKRIISHASLATTLILYLVVWSSWANTAQGWLSQPSPCPEGPQAVPDCSGTGGEQGHCWISLGALHFPPPLLDGVFVLVLGVSQQNTEAPHCSTDPGNVPIPWVHLSMEYWFNCSTSPFSQQFHPGYVPHHDVSKNTMSEGQDNTSGIFSPAPLSTGSLPLQRKKKCLTDVTHYIVDKPIPSNIILSSMFPNNLIIFPVVFQTLKLTDCLASSSSLSQHFIFLKTFVSLGPVHPPVLFRQSTALTSQQAPKRNVKTKLILKISTRAAFYWDMTYQFSDERSCRRLIHPFPRGISA